MVEIRSSVVVRVGDFGVFGGVVGILEEIGRVTTLVLFFVQHLSWFMNDLGDILGTYIDNVGVGARFVGIGVFRVLQEDFIHVSAGVLEELVRAGEN